MPDDDFYPRAAVTWVGEAEFVGDRFFNISSFGGMSVTSNRPPYPPEGIVSAAVGCAWG